MFDNLVFKASRKDQICKYTVMTKDFKEKQRAQVITLFLSTGKERTYLSRSFFVPKSCILSAVSLVTGKPVSTNPFDSSSENPVAYICTSDPHHHDPILPLSIYSRSDRMLDVSDKRDGTELINLDYVVSMRIGSIYETEEYIVYDDFYVLGLVEE